jgi:hypothetical protein
MIRAHIEGLDDMTRGLGAQARQIPFALSVALNQTAKDLRTATYAEMRAKFDRPTPHTLRSLFIDPSSKQNLEAHVFLKDRSAGGNNAGGLQSGAPGAPEGGSMAAIIGHLFRGGSRIPKRIEEAFAGAGLIRPGEYLLPGPGAKLDRYGNMSRGQVQQVYTALRLHYDSRSNFTDSARSRRNARAAGRMFWSRGESADNGRRRGLWVSNGRTPPQLLLAVIPRAVYRQRIDLNEIAWRIVPRVYPAHFEKALERALQSARR